MIYLDNAATSFPKPPNVYKKLIECVKEYCGNPGRSSHYLSVRSVEEIYKTRELVAKLLNIDAPERVVFTQNATYALNIAIKTAIPDASHVLISDIEHNSVIRPIEAIKRSRGVDYSVFSLEGDVLANMRSVMNGKTKTVVCNLLSNVNGEEADLSKISDFCIKHSLTLIVDASQKIGHKPINILSTPCNILCAPAHKSLFGIQGAGFLVINDSHKRESFIEGGGGGESKRREMPIYLPERYEAGTLPTPSIVSLGAGIEFILEVGIEEIERKINKLTEEVLYELSRNSSLTDISGASGVISFNARGIPSARFAELLDGYGICTRGGLHCAPLIHKRLGTDTHGSVRVSLSYLNEESDIHALFLAIKEILSVYS